MIEKGRKEVKMILDLQKIKPATKSIRLTIMRKNLRDAKRAKFHAMPRKSYIVSIPLTEDKVERPIMINA